MGCRASAPVFDESLFSPQLPIDTVLPILFASGDPVSTLCALEKNRLLPRNKFDLYRALGWDGHPPNGLSREEMISLFNLYLVHTVDLTRGAPQ